MKTLDDLKQDMSILYDELRDGKRELKFCAELANIAGKNLKAHQLELARQIFLNGLDDHSARLLTGEVTRPTRKAKPSPRARN